VNSVVNDKSDSRKERQALTSIKLQQVEYTENQDDIVAMEME
jgi:hypothetical protein